MKTIQKRVKFSKGEINPLLDERTDIGILDESASYIKNYIPTIYGGIKTRQGTKFIEQLRNVLFKIENPIMETFIGGDINNIFNDTTFTSGDINTNQKLFNIKAEGTNNKFIKFNINKISFTKHTETTLNAEFEDVEDKKQLKALNIITAGNNYLTTPIITFNKENLSEGEELPQATAIIENKIITRIDITNRGNLLNTNNLVITIEQPQPFNEYINIKNSNGDVLETFNINETEQDINILLEDYIDFITIERENNDLLNTNLVLEKFVFGLSKPQITSNIGGDTSNFNNFESDLLKNVNGELLYFKFDSNINVFNLNSVKLKSGTKAVLRTRLRAKNGLIGDYYILDNIFIDNQGYGYEEGIQNINFTPLTTWRTLPEAQAIIEEGKVKSIQITEDGRTLSDSGGSGDNQSILADLPLPSFSINITLQAKDGEGNWINLSTFNINQEEEIQITGNIGGDGYREFRLITDNTNNVNTALQINNLFYGDLLNFVGDAKLIKLFYNSEEYIIVLSNLSILIYKDDDIVATLQNNKITSNIIREIKYTQANNKIYLTHKNIYPLELSFNDNVWTIKEMNLLNIPFTNFNEDIEQQITNITLTPSAEEGSISLSSNVGFFNPQSVGQIIDGNGGRLRITSFVSNVKVYGYTIIPFYTKDAFSNFKYITGYEPVWSETRGYPSTCLYYQQRLWFGGSKSKPTGLWGSRVGQNNDFNNIGNYNNDAIDVEISSKDNSQITNLYGNRGLQIFTETAEFVANEGNLNPNDIFITQTSSVGNNLKTQICDVAGTTLFVDRKGLNINTFVYDDSIASYQAQALTLLNNQLINNPISIDIDYNSSFEDGNFIFLVNSDGTVITNNILLEQKINSATRFIIDGFKIMDVAVLNNKTYMLVSKNESTYLIKLDNYKTDLTIKQYINNTNIISNLELYNNQYVRVYNDNNDYGSYLVENGNIALEESITGNVFIGLDIDCQLISNDISINGNSNNIKSRIAKAVITTTQDTNKIIFNNKSPQPHKEENNNIFSVLSAGSYSVKNNFKIQSKFDFLELKSIVLIINYGK